RLWKCSNRRLRVPGIIRLMTVFPVFRDLVGVFMWGYLPLYKDKLKNWKTGRTGKTGGTGQTLEIQGFHDAANPIPRLKARQFGQFGSSAGSTREWASVCSAKHSSRRVFRPSTTRPSTVAAPCERAFQQTPCRGNAR